jgi:hypothetical protein
VVSAAHLARIVMDIEASDREGRSDSTGDTAVFCVTRRRDSCDARNDAVVGCTSRPALFAQISGRYLS